MPDKILVADDDPDNRTIAAEILESAGYQVLRATDGREALDLAVQEQPALIFLDLSMPRMDGYETVRRLKAMPEVSGIPVIAFTAHAMVGDDRKARDAGCDDYLSKPCLPQRLLEKVQGWSRKRAGDRP